MTVSDSVFAPSAVELKDSENAVFYRGSTGTSVSNSYYTSDFGTVNTGAKKVYTVTAQDGIQIDFGAARREYTVSGVAQGSQRR